MTKDNIIKLDPSLVGTRLALCAAALAGTAAGAGNANAAIITFSTPILVPQTTAGVYINFLTGANGTSAGAVPGWDFNPYSASGGTQLGFYWSPTLVGGLRGAGVASTTTGPYISLNPGDTVSAASIFTSAILGTTGSPFLTTGTHILGFRFANETTGALNFGYLTMTNTATSGFPSTVLTWSFDNTGAPITVAIPEPSTVAFLSVAALALGACGLRQWRRQRAA
jgi:hypothetical protein